MFDKSANRNTLWANVFVEGLIGAGLKAVVIAPGSRSTPLAMEFGSQPGLDMYVHPDERGAAYFALGLSLGSGIPAAVLCTSGTAVANLFPAVVEAYQSNVPLLILTADRPHELRESGANQTIDQVKIFGSFVRWYMEAAPPEADPPEVVVRYLLSLAGRAVAAALGQPPGPVHLNFPFRKPLEPLAVAGDAAEVGRWALDTGRWSTGRMTASDEQIGSLAQVIQQAGRGLIVCGPRCPGGEFPQAVTALAAMTGYPILADALSGVRFSAGQAEGAAVLGGYETFLRTNTLPALEPPELVIQIGAAPISAALNDYLGGLKDAKRVMIDGHGRWSDEAFRTDETIWADPLSVCRRLAAELTQPARPVQPLGPRSYPGWQAAWQAMEDHAWQAIRAASSESYFEGGLAAIVLDHLQPGDALFTASSLPVRHLDQFGQPRSVSITTFANRGASGIDGTIASAAGAAFACAAADPGSRTVLLIGDLAFYHDLNSLLLLRNYPANLTVVLINNDGGGIFERLPVASYEPLFTKLFRTPHGLSFSAAAGLFGLAYKATGPSAAGAAGQPFGEFTAALQAALTQGGVTIIEAAGDARANDQTRRAIIERHNKTWGQGSQ